MLTLIIPGSAPPPRSSPAGRARRRSPGIIGQARQTSASRDRPAARGAHVTGPSGRPGMYAWGDLRLPQMGIGAKIPNPHSTSALLFTPAPSSQHQNVPFIYEAVFPLGPASPIHPEPLEWEGAGAGFTPSHAASR